MRSRARFDLIADGFSANKTGIVTKILGDFPASLAQFPSAKRLVRELALFSLIILVHAHSGA